MHEPARPSAIRARLTVSHHEHDTEVGKIRSYASHARELHHGFVNDDDASTTETRLEQAVQVLKASVQEQRAALERIQSQSSVDLDNIAYASEDPRPKIRQLRAVTSAYKQLKPSTTFLPAHASLLPALLAARTLQRNVRGTKDAIASTQAHLDAAEMAMRREEAYLLDANLLMQTMENRISRLRLEHQEQSQKSPAQLARELIAAKQTATETSNAEMQRLGDAMNDFINNYLSPMIAAEELGGPVTGDLLEVEDDTLATGFTKQGRARLSKKPVSEKSRQRRIDQIWSTNNATHDEDDPPTEAEAADAEMRKLIEDLFATLTVSGGSSAYYQLQRDSAASRFLVRAKIAQFHPKDARKIRLVDFGRELDD